MTDLNNLHNPASSLQGIPQEPLAGAQGPEMDGAGHGTMAMGGKSMGGVWRSLNHVFVAVLSVVTITLPTMFVRMLSTTLTLQLDFTKM